MMFIILDKDPHIAAWEIPNKIKFKICFIHYL